MKKIEDILFEICETERVYEPDIDLIESGILDSYAVIELLAELEDEGIELQITQIDRKLLHTVKGIKQLVNDNI